MSETDQSSSVEDLSILAEDESGVLAARHEKGPHAFRTISEVADELHVPQHVLRFWETRFEQVRPLKRGGGRRYYRPADVDLLRHIADLLYAKGYTVKGVQRLLREGEGLAAQQETVLTQEAAPAEVQADAPPAEAVSTEAVSTEAASIEKPFEEIAPVAAGSEAFNPTLVVDEPARHDGGGEHLSAETPESASSEGSFEMQPEETVSAVDAVLAEQRIQLREGAGAFTPDQGGAMPAPVPEAASGEQLRRLEKQTLRLKTDLADILVELEAFRNRLMA